MDKLNFFTAQLSHKIEVPVLLIFNQSQSFTLIFHITSATDSLSNLPLLKKTLTREK